MDTTMSRAKYDAKIQKYASLTMFCIVGAATLNAFGVDIPIPTPAELGSWPAQAILGAVALVTSMIAYKTWGRVFELQSRVTTELRELREELVKRPCINQPKQTDKQEA